MYFVYAFPRFTQGTRKFVNQVVSIVPCYGLHKPGFESWQEQEDFSLLQNAPLALVATQPFIQLLPDLFSGKGRGKTVK
jgi:hypothetical protein